MKNFFGSRAGAALVLALVVIFATAFSVHRSLGAACEEITAGFYNGVYDADWGTERPAVAAQLETQIDASAGLLSLADTLSLAEDITTPLREARYALMEAESISEKYTAAHALQPAFETVAAEIGQSAPDARQQEMLDDYVSRFQGAADTIEDSQYNNSVREFERSTLNVFPTNLLKALVKSEIPERFEG